MNDPPDMTSYDPLVDGVRQQLRTSQQRLWRMMARPPSRPQQWLIRLRLTARAKWLDAILLAVPIAFIAGSVVVFVASWPWRTQAEDSSAVVIACASVVALGSIILSAVALPFTRAADFGPGFTTSLMRRPLPWLLGLTIAPLSTFLFWLSTRQPDSDAALASGLLAGGAFSAFWAASRALFGAADSLSIAQREAARVENSLFDSIGTMESLAKRMVVQSNLQKDTTKEVAEVAAEAERIRLASGFIRYLRSAARRCFAKGETEEGLIFWNAMLQLFMRFAKFTNGAVGTYEETTGVILEAADDFIAAAMRNSDDFVAVQCTTGLKQIATLPFSHPDSASARSAAKTHLVRVADQTWEDEASRVPATAIACIGETIPTLVHLNARQDVEYNLQLLGGVADKAVMTGKVHLQSVAIQFIVRSLKAFALQEPPLRLHYSIVWSRVARDVSLLRLKQGRVPFMDPLDQLLPGMVLIQGTGLQTEILEIATARPDALPDIMTAAVNWMDGPLLAFADAHGRGTGSLADGLAVLLCLGLALIQSPPEPERCEKLALQMTNVVLGWPAYQASVPDHPLFYDDVAELTWSNLLVAACLADDPAILKSASQRLLPILEASDGNVRQDGYIVIFRAGLHLSAGADTEDVDALLQNLRSGEDWYGSGLSLHIEPLGRAPSVNRNRTAHFPNAVEKVNSWAVRNFPGFAYQRPNDEDD